MKKAFYTIFTLLIFCSCSTNSEVVTEDKIDIDYKSELSDNMKMYKETYESKVISLKEEIDSIKNMVSSIEYVNISTSEKPPIDLKSNFFFSSIHDYDKIGDMNIPPLDFVNSMMNKIRRGKFEDTPTQFERRLKYLEDYYLDSITNFDDEKKLSVFKATTAQMDEFLSAKYVIIINDYLMLKPELKYGEYIPGEVLTGVFLYNRDLAQLEDQFVISSGNDKDIVYDKSGDVNKDREVAIERLMTMLKSNYDKKLVESISKRYSLKEKPSIFF